MSTWQAWAAVLALAVGTFLIRYSFIGLFANKEIPAWLSRCLQLMVPAIFAAIVSTGLFIQQGQNANWEHWPKFCAAFIAFCVARAKQGHIFYTVFSGMVFLHIFEALKRGF